MKHLFHKLAGPILVILLAFGLSFLYRLYDDSVGKPKIANHISNKTIVESPESKILLGQKIDLNTADARTLEVLPGIGPAIAKRIIKYRTEHGAFRSVDGLLDVNGIGPKTIEKIRQYVE